MRDNVNYSQSEFFMKAGIRTIELNNDHLKRVSNVPVKRALSELIWNSLDADSNNVSVTVLKNDLGVYEIQIHDDGSGIFSDLADAHFTAIGGSWKAKKPFTNKGRCMHGQKGEGRFKSFSIGRVVSWQTTFKDNKDNKFYRYSLTALAEKMKEIEFSDMVETESKKQGTAVTINEIYDNVQGDFNNLIDELTPIFAPYLYSYRDISVTLNGEKIDPNIEIDSVEEIFIYPQNQDRKDSIKVINWKRLNLKELYLCKENGAVLSQYALSSKLKTHGYKFSIYLNSKIIGDLHDDGQLSLVDLHQDCVDLIDDACKIINKYFQDKKNEEKAQIVEQWKKEGIYPYEDVEKLGEIEKVERDVFDIVAVNVANNLPKFRQSDTVSKKLTFKLLSQAIQDNPSAMNKILTEVLSLGEEEQDMLMELLERTSLSSIIKSAKLVTDRLNFIDALEDLLFNHKKSLLERDELHKILEKEAWIFDEQFTLSGSERRLADALKIHLHMLGKRTDDLTKDVLINNEKKGRIDLMLHKSVEVRPGYRDYLIVELKRPSQKITMEVIGQIMGYAQAISQDERFDKHKTQWKFIAVSNEFDDIAEMHANNDDRPRGLVYAKDGLTVFVMKWSEIINNARARLNFYRDQLKYEADDESKTRYLKDKHEKYLPKTFN